MKTNIGLIAAVMLLSATAFGQITPSSSTTSWTPIQYGAGNIPDPSADQQTGSSEGDVVGNISNPSLYTAFDNGGTTGILTDGQLGFRFRVGADKSPAGYKGAAFVGLDLDANGSLDVFAGVNNSGSSSLVGLWWAAQARIFLPAQRPSPARRLIPTRKQRRIIPGWRSPASMIPPLRRSTLMAAATPTIS